MVSAAYLNARRSVVVLHVGAMRSWGDLDD